MLDQVCGESTSSQNLPYMDRIQTVVNDFEEKVVQWSSDYMCSAYCKCPSTLSLNNWEEARLNKYYRTKTVTNKNATVSGKNC